MKYKINTVLFCTKDYRNNVTYQCYTKGSKYKIAQVYDYGYLVPDDIDPIAATINTISRKVLDEYFATREEKLKRILK